MLGDLAIDYAQRLVSVAGKLVRLTAVEYDLLQQVWGKTEPPTPG